MEYDEMQRLVDQALEDLGTALTSTDSHTRQHNTNLARLNLLKVKRALDTASRPYTRRNLPCCQMGGTEMPWCITGQYEDETGPEAGVLEWCYDEKDTRTLLSKMSQDPRYSHLKAVRS